MPLRKKALTKSTRTFSIRPYIKIIAVVIGVIVLVVLGIFVIRKNPAIIGIGVLAPPEQGVDNSLILEEVGRIIELPADETPTIATVTDPLLLADQPFFQKSQQGDVALVYVEARKAILYRPSAKKIIEVGVVNADAAAQVSPEPTATPIPTNEPTDGSTIPEVPTE